jgi:hypothetical protein
VLDHGLNAVLGSLEFMQPQRRIHWFLFLVCFLGEYPTIPSCGRKEHNTSQRISNICQILFQYSD